MIFYDRLTQKVVPQEKLPKSIDLGRFSVSETDEWMELTSEVYKCQNGQVIKQKLLDEKYLSVHKVLKQIHDDTCYGTFSAIPLIQGVNNLTLSEFDDSLCRNVDHLFAILQNPYSLLDRRIEKVPVARAKRISPKSYQYLAGHTEDWLHKSITSFRPSRILTEELDLNYDVYENQLLVAFIHRTIKYLAEKITKAKYIYEFLKRYTEIVDSSSTGWPRKVNRSLKLAGLVYSDPDYKGGRQDTNKTGKTLRLLEDLQHKMQKMLTYDLMELVDKRVIHTIEYHDTNVLVGHPHYRYLKELWRLLNLYSGKDSLVEQGISQQDVASYLIDYGISLVNYSVKNYIGYKIVGSDRSWFYVCPDGMRLSLDVQQTGIIKLQVGSQDMRFIMLGNMPDDSICSILNENKETYILAYNTMDSMGPIIEHNQIIPIGLQDIECVEAVAMVIKKAVLTEYVNKYIYNKYSYPPILREYVKYLNTKGLQFSSRSDFYRFLNYPKLSLSLDDIIDKVRKDESFRRRPNSDRSMIERELENLILDIEIKGDELKDNLYCFDLQCSTPLSEWNCQTLKYIKCECGFVLDSSNPDSIVFKDKNSTYDYLSPQEYGIDYLEISIDDTLF